MSDAAREGGRNTADASGAGAGDERDGAAEAGSGGQRGQAASGGTNAGQSGTGGAGKGSASTGGAGQSTGGAGQSTGGAGQSTGGAGQSTGGAGQSTGGAGQSTGGAGRGSTGTGGVATSTGGAGAILGTGANGGTPDAGSGQADAGAAGHAGAAGNPGNGGTHPAGGTGGAGNTLPRAPVAGDLVIDELLIDPNGTDTGKEWIELLNLTADPLDLSQLVVADDVGEHPLAATEMSPEVAPHARVVLGQTSDAGKNGGAPVDFVYGTKLGLNNDGDRAAICWQSCAVLLLDEVRWTMSDPALVGHALQIQRDGSRCPALTPYGTASAGAELNHGTPGAPNSACP